MRLYRSQRLRLNLLKCSSTKCSASFSSLNIGVNSCNNLALRFFLLPLDLVNAFSNCCNSSLFSGCFRIFAARRFIFHLPALTAPCKPPSAHTPAKRISPPCCSPSLERSLSCFPANSCPPKIKFARKKGHSTKERNQCQLVSFFYVMPLKITTPPRLFRSG